MSTDPQLPALPENPTPQDFGFPEHPTTQQLHAWANQELFLDALSRHGRICDAAREVGITVWTAERWDFMDLYGFKRRKQWAKQAHLERIEAEIERRAIEGTDHPVIYKGQITDTYKEYSDNLLMFRAKRLDPAYKDNYQAPVQDNRSITIVYNIPPGGKAPPINPWSTDSSNMLPDPDTDSGHRETTNPVTDTGDE